MHFQTSLLSKLLYITYSGISTDNDGRGYYAEDTVYIHTWSVQILNLDFSTLD